MGRNWVSLCETLRTWAETRPKRIAYGFLADGERESGTLTYAELWQAASSLAASLREHAAVGERALLLYSDGLEFIVAFFACLRARIVPVPVYPPRKNRRLELCGAVAVDCGAKVVLTSIADAKVIGASLESHPYLAALPIVRTDEPAKPGAWLDEPLPSGGDLAFLQYTSGSTGQPKGVAVTHANLVNNELAVCEAFGHTDDTVFVGWLPLFHDMGLIGNVLQPMHLGIPAYLMPPSAFLQRPVRWLRAISRYRASTSGAPNFAYELCAKKVKPADLEGLDLSCWKVAYNGSEPVRAGTLQRFSALFAACGFDSRAHYPCYGMAETTLFISGGRHGQHRIREVSSSALERDQVAAPRHSADVAALVSCGNSWQGNSLRIVHAQTACAVPDGTVGEIWARGPSVAQGYWNKPQLTAELFGATISGEPESGTWFRTGDLGFMHGGELFVTGRLKDMIIVRGRNHYPQDIELTAESSHASIAPGRVAAFAIEDEATEQLVLIVEVDLAARASANPDEIKASVRTAVTATHEIAPAEIIVVRPGGLPITSSGKVQRSKCKSLYARRDYPEFQSRRPPTTDSLPHSV